MLALAASLLSARAAVAGCRVRGEHVTLGDVVVRPDRSDAATAFEVDLNDVPAQATIGAGNRVRVDVSGAIAFRGSRQNVWFTVARPVVVAGGVVRLVEGAELVHARADGDDVVASVVLWADDVLPGEDKDPDDVILGVRVPCRALRLGSKKGASDEVDDDDGGADLEPALGWWQNRGSRKRIVVRAAPRADADGVTLATETIGEGLFDFEGVEQRGGWLRVRRVVWGAEIVGWIRRAELVAMDGPMGRSTMCVGNHGGGFHGRGWGGKPPVVRYRGPARLRVGARIDFSDGDPWAKVREDTTFEVVIYEDQPYAELTHIPGIGVPSWYAMVSVGDVILPARGSER